MTEESNRLNRFHADRLAKGDNVLAEAIFSELQLAQKRGEIMMELEIKNLRSPSATIRAWQEATGKTCDPDLGMLIEWLMLRANIVDAAKDYDST